MSNHDGIKSELCIACVRGASLLKAAAAVMTSNAQITGELADLLRAIGSWDKVPKAGTDSDSYTTASTLPAKERTIGSGAGSVQLYNQIMKRNGHGRLGRTHMDDVERLPETARTELDNYLRRTISEMAPVGGGYQAVNADALFATLSAFGLGLEDRNGLADVVVFNDADHQNTSTIARLQNSSAHFYTAGTNRFDSYWKALALETIVELARYRRLFGSDGFLKPVQEL